MQTIHDFDHWCERLETQATELGLTLPLDFSVFRDYFDAGFAPDVALDHLEQRDWS